MASNTLNLPTVASGESELLSDGWSQEPSLEEDGLEVYHALSAASLLAAASPEGGEDETSGEPASSTGVKKALLAGLDLLIALFGAERAFLFGAEEEGRNGNERLPESCLASRNFDGEEIQQPEEKAPHDFLSQVALCRRPLLGGQALAHPAFAEAKDGEVDAVYRLSLPVQRGRELLALLYLENRFRPLQVTRATLRLSEVHCHILAGVIAQGRLQDENRSLWLDISRLRESNPPQSKLPELPRLSETSRGGRSLKRSDLKGDYSMIIGSSPQMIEMFKVLDRISGSNAPVLITGESGTGKELIAQAVHHNSPRRGKDFVSENCGALTETLLESELFGYVKGAFTGAHKDHKGLFELAVGGTLFLDEVGDMSPGMQKKLLRVLQEGVIRRVGGKDYVSVDVRIISATNKDLLEEVRAGNFREDLYYRLNVIHLKLPPLRERKEDIPELVKSFLAALERESGVVKEIEPAALQYLMRHAWPGNIRELQNEVRRMFALAEGSIRVQDLSETILAGEREDSTFEDLGRDLSRLTLREATDRLEKQMICNALVQCRGNKSMVAKVLEVPKTSLYNKINKYGLDKV